MSLDGENDRLCYRGRVGEEAVGEKCAADAGDDEDRGTGDKGPCAHFASIRGGSTKPGHHRDHPHRGQQRAALESAAGIVRAGPEDMKPDHRSRGRENPCKKDQRVIRPFRPNGAAARSGVVLADGPDADDRQYQDDLFQHRRTERYDMRTAVIACRGPRLRHASWRRPGASVGAGLATTI